MIKVFNNPPETQWKQISQRSMMDDATLTDNVKKIISDVKVNGDKALKEYSIKFDGIIQDSLRVTKDEFDEAALSTREDLKAAIGLAMQNIEKFHASQIVNEGVVEIMPGVKCWRKSLSIEKVGLYVPGGSAPLFSTVLMLAIPAKIADCQEVILCTPPQKNGKIAPAILYAAQLTGIKKVFKVGGAQAVAAMAWGTETIPAVYKIFGPGNQYVTRAKELVQQMGVAIDMPAGPSEVLVIADKTSNAAFVAADLLSQAEHGPDSQAVLISDSIDLINNVQKEIEIQLALLPRKETAAQALQNCFAVDFSDISRCMKFSNFYAPEHLILACSNYIELSAQVINAGSVFLGNYSCESAGDYASGTNHTLPTNAYARNYSGVSLESFMKKITFQEITEEGLYNIGPAIEVMAEAEQLSAHRNAVSIRLNKGRND